MCVRASECDVWVILFSTMIYFSSKWIFRVHWPPPEFRYFLRAREISSLSLSRNSHKLGFIELDAVCLFSKSSTGCREMVCRCWQAIGMRIAHSRLLWIYRCTHRELDWVRQPDSGLIGKFQLLNVWKLHTNWLNAYVANRVDSNDRGREGEKEGKEVEKIQTNRVLTI